MTIRIRYRILNARLAAGAVSGGGVDQAYDGWRVESHLGQIHELRRSARSHFFPRYTKLLESDNIGRNEAVSRWMSVQLLSCRRKFNFRPSTRDEYYL